MADKEDNNKDDERMPSRISDQQRFQYIGFEVFPRPAKKDLYASDAEREAYLQEVRRKREQGQITRSACTLLEERMSGSERIVLIVASLFVIGSLFLPWFSAYNIIAEEAPVVTISQSDATLSDLTDGQASPDGLNPESSSPESSSEVASGLPDEAADLPEESIAANQEDAENGAETVTATETTASQITATGEGMTGNEEIITAQQFRKKTRKEYAKLSGIGGIIALGSYGGAIFSSGIGVILAVLFMVMFLLLSVAIPSYTIYNILSLKGDADEVALKLKRVFKLSWLPTLALFAALAVSFFGGSYSLELGDSFFSLGSSFGVAPFLGSLSWGPLVSLAGSVLVAAKGIEI